MIRYLPFQEGPHRLSMGLNPLDIAEWIEVDDSLAADLMVKNALLSRRHNAVFAEAECSHMAQTEVLTELVAHLSRYHSDQYACEGEFIRITGLDKPVELKDIRLSPLDIAGRLVQEDLCLMEQGADGAYLLTAASLCFPTRWLLSEKINRPIRDIHEPVPGFDSRLGVPIDRFFNALTPKNPVWRVNWSLVDSPNLHLSVELGEADHTSLVTNDNVGEKIFLRVERQTLRRMPKTDAILFTIRIYRHALAQVVSEEPSVAARLLAAVLGLPEDLRRYKSIEPFAAPLHHYLKGFA